VRARDESGGLINSVSDAEILKHQKLTASLSGIFGEPACAAPLAASRVCRSRAISKKRAKIWAASRSWFQLSRPRPQRPNTAIQIGGEPTVVPAESSAVLRAMGF
jgi:threonine synthase